MRFFLAAGTVLVLAGVACSSKSSNSTSSFVDQYCGLIEPCCSAAGLPATGSQCQLFVSAETSQASFDATAAQACLTAAQAEQAAGTFCTTLGGDIPACSQAFQQANGTAQPGQACTEDSDCAPAPNGGATCFDQGLAADGGIAESETCVQTLPGQVGEGPCIGTQNGDVTTYSWSGTSGLPQKAYVCNEADGTSCDFVSQVCVALAPVGQPCTGDSTCVASAYCNESTSSPVCAPRLADGSSCAAAPTGCLTTSECDSTTNTCTPLVATGQPCSANPQCQSASCVNGTCTNGLGNLGLSLLCGS